MTPVMFCDPKEHGSQFKQIVKAVNLVLKSPDPLLPTQLRKFRHLYLNNKSKRAKVTRKNRVNNDSGTATSSHHHSIDKDHDKEESHSLEASGVRKIPKEDHFLEY